MSSIEDVGVVIQVLRVIRGLSQGELAVKSGVRNSSISNYERGKSVPKLETLQKLADGMGLPLSVVEETQSFIDRVRSCAGLEGGLRVGPGTPGELGAVETLRLLRSQNPTALLSEADRLSSDVGRLASRLLRLILEVLLMESEPGRPQTEGGGVTAEAARFEEGGES